MLTAYLVLDGHWPDAPPAVAQIQAFLADLLPSHMWPRAVCWLDELPRLPGGKLDRRGLQRLRQAQPADPGAAGTDSRRLNAAEEYVIAAASHYLSGNHVTITPSDHFYALGDRSLDLMG